MKRTISISLLILLMVAGFWWFTRRPTPAIIILPPPDSSLTNFAGFTSSTNSNSVAGKSMAGVTPPLLGEVILRDYASPSTSPENDLTSLAHLMDNFTLLVKSAADLPLSANEDWAATLRGENPAQIQTVKAVADTLAEIKVQTA